MSNHSFLEEATQWREQALVFGSQVLALRATLTRVSERYFDSTPVILTEESDRLDGLAALWGELVQQFNEFVVSEFEQAPEGSQVARLEIVELTTCAEALASEQTPYMIDAAKAEALKEMGDDQAAVELMARWED